MCMSLQLTKTTWVPRTANSMDRVLKLKGYRGYVILKGESDEEK